MKSNTDPPNNLQRKAIVIVVDVDVGVVTIVEPPIPRCKGTTWPAVRKYHPFGVEIRITMSHS